MPTYTVELADGKKVKIKVPATPQPTGSTVPEVKPEEPLRGEALLAATQAESDAVLDKTLRGGALLLPGMIGDAAVGIPNWIGRKTGLLPDTPEATPGPEGYMMWPSDALAELTGGPIGRPTTPTGQTLGNVGESTVAAVTGGPLAHAGRSALIGLAAGVGGEVGAAATENAPVGRAVGALGGGGLMGIATALRPSWRTLVKDATKGVPAEQFAAAQQTKAALDAAGIPNIASQHLGPYSSLKDLVEISSASPGVRPQLLRAVPADGQGGIVPQTEQMLNAWSLQHLPAPPGSRRSTMAFVQEAAADAIRQADDAANAAFRAAMPPAGQVYPGQHIANLREELITLAKSEKFGEFSDGGKALLKFARTKLPKEVPAAPAQYSLMLDAAGKPQLVKPATEAFTRDMPQHELNNLMKDLNAMRLQEGWKGLPTKDLKEVLRRYTPEFEPARAAKAQVMAEVANPIRRGLAGRIAAMGGGPDAAKYTAGDYAKMVFGGDKNQAVEITQLGGDVGRYQVGHLLREYLSDSWQKVSKAQVGREGIPADFAAEIAGNTAKRANLNAGLTLVAKSVGANPKAFRKGFWEMVDALGTTKDLRLSGGIDRASANFAAGKSALGGLAAPQSAIRRYTWETASAKTYQKIAELVTSPNGIKLIEGIAREPDFKARHAALRGILAAGFDESVNNTPGITPE